MNVDGLARKIGERVPDVLVARGEVTAVVERERLLETLAWLRDQPDVALDFLSSVTATHWPDVDPAFWVDYELRSFPHKHRARVKVGLGAGDAHLSSVTPLFPTADWHERELMEMFGIAIEGHPRPVKLLLSEPFEGHPLRKDFALMSREAKPWPGAVEGEEDEDE